ncbi:MAG: hypothetical protein PQJ59_16825 [Spirochaetales bacterium]|nr:hypothetical protein [Spirochaetales bacterium]
MPEVIRITSQNMDAPPKVMNYLELASLPPVAEYNPEPIMCGESIIHEDVKQYAFPGQNGEFERVFIHGDRGNLVMEYIEYLNYSANKWKMRSQKDVDEFGETLRRIVEMHYKLPPGQKKPKPFREKLFDLLTFDINRALSEGLSMATEKGREERRQANNRIEQRKRERITRAYREFVAAILDY